MQQEFNYHSLSMAVQLEDNQVTIRDRDTMEQVRISIDEVENWIKERINF